VEADDMISKAELRDIGGTKGLSLGSAEKDYLIDLILFSISRNIKDELVFKGGTCLYKFYKLDRFSEDMDFSQVKPIDLGLLYERVARDLEKFGIEVQLSKKEVYDSVLTTFRAKGPLYDGRAKSMSSVRADINRKSSVSLRPVSSKLISLYPEVPTYSVLVMGEEEILTEKIRAVCTRNKARDLYDVWFLLKKGVGTDYELLDKKMGYYNLLFDRKDFLVAVENKKAAWGKELKPLLAIVPEFSTVRDEVLKLSGAALMDGV
jgi:predicted nucleotidyltransferase component of viral defense system